MRHESGKPEIRARVESAIEKLGYTSNAVAQMLAHEQTKTLSLLQDVPGSAMKLIRLPLSFGGVRPAIRNRPPRLGEHTEEFIKKSEG